ncbi:hypothetical protein [Vibrio kanaloae]|uniref:hypothetical protein n=1 Tax=Vibrio kanaloae TaxID=170673 RepID=UPI00148324BC|nr:hypothetical protein [Vibrio kanaloae]
MTAHYHGFDAWSTLSSRIAASKTVDPDERKLSGFFFIYTAVYCFSIGQLNLTANRT